MQMGIDEWSPTILRVDLAAGPAFAEDLSELIERLQTRPPHPPHSPHPPHPTYAPPSVVLDLSRVSYLVSSNLTQLLTLRKLAKEFQFKLLIAGVPTTLWSVFLTTGLDRLFEFAPDSATALAKITLASES